MAVAVRREFSAQYNNSLVYGSLAYELERDVREHELRHAGEMPREEAVPVTRTRSAAKVREAQQISLFSVVGFVAVAVMAVVVLMNYVQLTTLSSDVVELKNQLAVLETENVVLTAEYQQMYDLSAVKDAAAAAGMAKPVSRQVYYMDLSGGDSAVVYRNETPGVLSRLVTSLHHGVYAVVEYFN